jgi:hypothetical protein
VGTQIYDAAQGTFVTQLGPVHANDVPNYPSPAEEAEIIRRIDAGVFTREQAPAAAASLDAVTEVQELVRRIYIGRRRCPAHRGGPELTRPSAVGLATTRAGNRSGARKR